MRLAQCGWIVTHTELDKNLGWLQVPWGRFPERANVGNGQKPGNEQSLVERMPATGRRDRMSQDDRSHHGR